MITRKGVLSVIGMAFVVMLLQGQRDRALAAADAYAPPGPAPHSFMIPVPVTATITGACGFATSGAPSGTYDAGELNSSFTHDFPFTLECSVPLRMAVVSSNGGLLTSGSPQSGYTALRPYDVTLDIKGASSSEVSGTCTAANLLSTLGSSSCGFFGTATTSIGLLLNNPSFDVSGSYVRVSSSAYGGSPILIASDSYADTLTITLSPAQ